MNLVETENWKYFQIEKIFEVEKGERLIKTERIRGEIPLVTASSKKNGIVNFLNFKTYQNRKKKFSNVITIDMFFNVFYQKNDFFADDNVHILKIKEEIELNKYIAIFLISCFKKVKKKYDFGRQLRLKRLLNECIKLPVNTKDKPDFKFMEKYIKDVSKKINYNQNLKFKKTNSLENKKNWEEYKITDLFKVRGSKKSFTQHQILEGDYFYITTSNKNNGFSGTSHIFTEEGNVITFDSATEGKCFYQRNSFIGSDHVKVLEPINFELNKYSGMFLITILNMEIWRYSFGRKRAQKRMKIDTIYLPTKIENNNQKPDFEFMEKYIKSLPYSKYL